MSEAKQETKLEEMLRLRRPPAAHGLSDGPGSAVNEMTFNRPDVAKEMKLTCKKMEESGYFKKHPEDAAELKKQIKIAESTPRQKVDYEKEGNHPLDRIRSD